MSNKQNEDFELTANVLKHRLTAVFWIIAVVLGAFHAWDVRHTMNADGISYLDMGDAYLRGDWKMAINAYWSPLYSWLLGSTMLILQPSSYNEFTVVHLVNYIVYLFAMCCFHFFLMQLVQYHQLRPRRAQGYGIATFPDWAWIALGYSIFIHASLNLITLSSVSPDMFVAAFTYLASGILLRIRSGSVDYRTFVLLGASLGLGYLSKAAMFPLSFVFLSTALFSTGSVRKALPRVATAFIIFLLVAGPFILVLSNTKGRITFGDSGKYSYWFHVNNYKDFHWDGTPPGSGTPSHTSRRIFDAPEVYEFENPIGGTYPVWYDPSYWHEGIKVYFDFKEQVSVIKRLLKEYFHIFYPDYSVMIFGSLILFLMGHRRWLVVKDLAEQWILLVPALSALGMYCLVSLDDRYVAPFIVLLWLGVLSGIRMPDTKESKRLLKLAAIVIVTVMLVITIRNLVKDRNPLPHEHWNVADALNRLGVSPGDKVASIGYSHPHFWARLAKVRIIAEIPHEDIDTFWTADSQVKSGVIKAFRSTGAKAIVTNLVPGYVSPDDWQRIADTDYYVYILDN